MPSRLLFAPILYLLASALPTVANDVEAVLLRHRTAEQVLPVLQPLVDPGGSLSGMAGQLFIRSNPRNREQLKTALRSIDVPYRRLLVSVRRMSATGEHPDPGRAGVNGRVYSSRAASDDGVVQQVQTVDGVAAFIATEQSVPVQQEAIVPTPGGYGVVQSTTLRSAASGFSVVPRLTGDRVMIEIQSKRETMRANTQGAIEADRISATVSGRLGEWIRLGGGVAEDRRVISSAAIARPDQRVIWVKVDEAP
jgi:hypothetical protein